MATAAKPRTSPHKCLQQYQFTSACPLELSVNDYNSIITLRDTITSYTEYRPSNLYAMCVLTLKLSDPSMYSYVQRPNSLRSVQTA
jgi:hypothetical protein